jgi:hypothetical protein
MPREVAMRHRLPHFQHVFVSDDYSAGYYSYLWADAISADAYEAFAEARGLYDKGVAARLHRYVFSVGNAVDPADGYRSFRGRDPGIGALMVTAASPSPQRRRSPQRPRPSRGSNRSAPGGALATAGTCGRFLARAACRARNGRVMAPSSFSVAQPAEQ